MPEAIKQGENPLVVKVGSKISVTVTKVGSYGNAAQIVEAKDWAVTAVQQPVYIDERTGKSLTVEDTSKLVRVTGVLTGEHTACGTGDNKCWSFEYAGQTPVVFRSASKFLATGDCVTFVGPVGRFNDDVQLNTTNFGWVWNNKAP